MTDDLDDLQPGLVIDADDLDAKLITLKMHGSPHFTGMEMNAIAQHFHKDLSELELHEMQIASAWVYLNRATGKEYPWEVAETRVTVEIEDRLDPTEPPSSET